MISEGVKISHYKVVSKIGAGGMGEVYLAEDTNLERLVALKVLLPDLANDEDRVRRFEQEAKAASALNHPNILTVFEVGVFENTRYIATEFVRGLTLRDRMNRGSMALGEMFAVTLQVTAALCAAHEAGIVHRDIKPDNIMIRGDGLVKVLDFGLAKLITTSVDSGDTTLAQINTHPGMLIGTAAYMSPEQARGLKLDARSDIFSLGIVMFELFTGKRPFDGEGHLDIISSILKDQHRSLREVAPDLPEQLERLVDKTLRKDRDHRYQHVKDLQIDIEDLRDELDLENKLNRSSGNSRLRAAAATDIRPTLTASISRTRRFTILHALLIAVAAAVLVSVVWYVRSASSPPTPAPGSYKTTEIASWNSAPGELLSNARFSPDGKLIAFASTKSGTKNIWVTQTTSTEAIQITNDTFSNIDPVWSPKGDEIAYVSDRGNGSAGNTNLISIWRVSALGGTPKFVGTMTGAGGELRRWASSGKIYYELAGNLYAMDVATGASQRITLFEQTNIRWINISPDESLIAYETQSEGVWKLSISDPANTRVTETAHGTGELDGIAWLPEKNRIFYSVPVDGVTQIFFIDIGSQKSTRVTASEIDSSIVDAAPDGRSVIFSSAKEESNLWRVSTKGGQDAAVARDMNIKLWPSVSPDDGQVVFQSVKNMSLGNKLFAGGINVKPMNSRGDGARPAVLAESGFLPAWSPDGSTIAYLKEVLGVRGLYTINPNGGVETRLTSGGISEVGYSASPYNYLQAKEFAWSPDSSQIAYISDRDGFSNIWVVGSRSGSDNAITRNNDPDVLFSCPLWSMDGKRIAFYFHKKSKDANGKTARGVKVLDVTSGEATEVIESTTTLRLIGWAPDDSGLIISESDKVSTLPPETVLKRIAIANGAEIELARLKNTYFYNIFLSDDRKFIAFVSRNDDKDDIWIVSGSGGVARKVTGNNDSALYYSRLAWLHDGSAIVFGKQTRYTLLSMISDIN